jgi:phosphoribosylanthranilate isomerase
VQVKICGVRTPAGARACASAGADFAGLNFVAGVRREVSPEQAAELLPLLGNARPVAVFRDDPIDRVADLASGLGIRRVQLHGAESPAACARLREAGLIVIKALTLDDAGVVRAYADAADVLLVDGRSPGSGRPWDYEALLDVRRASGDSRPGQLAGAPLWLAGGLDAGNVAQAIAALRPAGVDAATGVERDGTIDAARVLAFCRAARAAGGEP